MSRCFLILRYGWKSKALCLLCFVNCTSMMQTSWYFAWLGFCAVHAKSGNSSEGFGAMLGIYFLLLLLPGSSIGLPMAQILYRSFFCSIMQLCTNSVIGCQRCRKSSCTTDRVLLRNIAKLHNLFTTFILFFCMYTIALQKAARVLVDMHTAVAREPLHEHTVLSVLLLVRGAVFMMHLSMLAAQPTTHVCRRGANCCGHAEWVVQCT